MDDITALLRVNKYFQGASDGAIADAIAAGRVQQYAEGEVVHNQEDPVTKVGFLLRGRLKAVKVDAHGRETLFRVMERGDQLGMMLGALQEPVPVRVFALEPSTVLEVESEDAMELTLKHPELRKLWLKTYASGLRTHFFGTAGPRPPALIGFIHDSAATHGLAEKVVSRLAECGEKIAVFGESEHWRRRTDVRFRSLSENGSPLSLEAIRDQVAEWKDATRVIFEVAMQAESGEALMRLVDRALYFAPGAAADSAVAKLDSLGVERHGWRDKLSMVWLLEPGRNTVAVPPRLKDLASRDFKIAEAPPAHPWGRSVANGLERLIHDLRGIRIGVALGGGAARGMAHLGVLKALEQAGIVVDMIAGTSAGAMTGVVYSSGLDSDYSAQQFATDLQPSWLFRRMPGGKHWFLLWKYRRGHFDPMLRKYLHDWKLEQLPIPCFSVTVDLVSGNSVVRERGDATHAVLESINLPVLSVPICRGGQALIDGGLVNNIPADVLVQMGCNFVIAVSVTAKMEHEFAAIKPDSSAPPGKRPSTLQTLLRSLLVQNHSLNAFGVRPADVVIEPDVTGFDLTEFMRSKELAAVGEAAAAEQIPRIRQLLAPQLFRFSNAA
ncbi:MAG: patatin-like phospholipase family protein [Gemmataceae bacterium]